MVEVTKGIFEASKEIYSNNRGSILRTIVYTVGHFAIAITVLMLVADVSFMIALTDAIVAVSYTHLTLPTKRIV